MSKELQAIVNMIGTVVCSSIATLYWIGDGPVWIAIVWTVSTTAFASCAYLDAYHAGMKWVVMIREGKMEAL